jgi:hypothetical protein
VGIANFQGTHGTEYSLIMSGAMIASIPNSCSIFSSGEKSSPASPDRYQRLIMQRDTSRFPEMTVPLSRQGGFDFSSEYHLVCDGVTCRSAARATDGGIAQVDFFLDYRQVAIAEDRVSVEGNLATVRRRWTLLQGGRWVLGSRFSAAFGREGELLVPAVMYRDNALGKGAFPTREEAASWSFLETRAPLGGCVHWYGPDKAFTVAVKPSVDASLLCSSSFSWKDGRAWGGTGASGSGGPLRLYGKERAVPLPRESAPVSPWTPRRSPSSWIKLLLPPARRPRGHPSTAPIGASSPRWLGARRPRGPCGGCPHAGRAPRPAVEGGLVLVRLAQDRPPPVPRGGGIRRKTAYLAMGKGNGDLQAIYDYTAGSFLVKSLEGAVILSRIEGRAGRRSLCALQGTTRWTLRPGRRVRSPA